MDPIRISRKRKSSSSSRSHPLSGRLTRSKSQIFLHRNRSGHLHSDSRRRQQPYARSRRSRSRLTRCLTEVRQGSPENDVNNEYDDDVMVLIKDLRKKRKGKPNGEDSNCDGEDVSRVLIKDIRLRRIYSTQSSGGCSDREGMVDSDCGDQNVGQGIDEMVYGLQNDQKCDGKNDENCSEKIADLSEEMVLTTPHDANVCDNSDVNGGEGKTGEEARVGVENTEKNVLRPCSQENLFKTPATISYKRQFPFLMEIMGDDFGTSKLGDCQKNEKGVNGGQEFQLPLSSQSQEGSKCELKADSCTILDTCQSGASECDALIAHVDELYHDNGSKLQSREVTSECLSVSSLNDICLSESKVRDAGNSLHNDDFKQGSNNKRNLDHANATNHCGSMSEQFGVLNEECILTTPLDAMICDNLEVNLSQLQRMPQDVHHVKPMGLARSTPENSGEVFCVTADKRKDPVPKSKSVPRPILNRKLFKTPGSISYRRMLPFLKDFTKDDSVISEFCHLTLHKKDEIHMYAEKFEVPLSSQGLKASIEEHKTDSGHKHGTVKYNALVNNVLVDPANELSHSNQPQLTPSPGILESPMQLDAKGVNGLSAPSPSEHIEKVEIGSKDVCLSDLKFDLCLVKSTTPEAQNLLYINDVSSLALENCSSKQNGLTIDCDERKQFEGLEKRESFIRNPPEGQGLNHLDPNMLDVKKEAGRKIIYEKSDMTKHASEKEENDLNGIVYGPSVSSRGSNNGSGNCVGENRNGSESKALLAINRCSREKLLKHAGSFSYKRMLPFILNTMKDNPRVSVIDHYPKHQKCLDQTPLLAVSASDLQVIPISGSDDCRGNSGTQQETGLHAHGLNNDSSSPIPQIPESQSSHDSCKVIQLQDEQVVLNGSCNLKSSPDPSISVHKIDSPIMPLGPTINKVITREEETMSPIPLSSIYPELKGNSSVLISYNGGKTPEAPKYCQSLSQHKVLDQIRVPAAGFKKGILKKNPKGCRGLCTCLNCVSFRLHAERSFEFSRNQFLDAEEVAQDLIKEISDLRNMLERSSVSVDGNPVVCAREVEEACQKAFATEQLAKDRLSQMNDDLNIHCRVTSLQRPRVKFTDHVEEKVIQP
ncbi:hypothetical protein TanjilG_13951 [Lupinus angustifolius]|uniref:Uncharacterized protein n=1 Tax=Lupinus angustifolius TaxID=3871 RepID=A0A1J7J1X0_LUPAN|nr:hypothetical protein TanjilG_13951 [Lupinus angustifolius]